jgi:small subunit ribosomal protein S11
MADEKVKEVKADKAAKPAKADKADKAVKADKAEKVEKADKADKAEKADKQAKAPAAPAAAAAPAAGDKPAEPGAAPAALGEEVKPKKAKIKGGKHIPFGIVFVRATFNNTLVSVSDMKGNVVAWSTAGRSGFKGSRKSTAFAATMAAQDAARQALGHGMQEVEVHVQGPGSGRESAIRAIQAAGLNITCIRDITPVPHNGCRPPKRRRV